MSDHPELNPAEQTLADAILKDFPFTHETVTISNGHVVSRIKGPSVNYYIDTIEADAELCKYRAAYLLGRTHPATPAILDRIIRTLYFAEAVVHPKHRTRIAAAITEIEQIIDHR